MLADTVKISHKGKTCFIAHRGVSGLECENTAASFIAAGNRTYKGIETDIWHTSDGCYLCNHDGRTGRICDVDLVIEDNTFDELRKLKLRDRDGVSDRGELILPTPYEYMKICSKYNKLAVPELKSDFTEKEIAEILAIFEPWIENTCFISFNMENLDLVKKLKPDQRCQYLSGAWNDDFPGMLEYRGMGLDIEKSQLTKERIKACHEHGVEVNAWTVDSPEDAERLISWEIDFITTNILE